MFYVVQNGTRVNSHHRENMHELTHVAWVKSHIVSEVTQGYFDHFSWEGAFFFLWEKSIFLIFRHPQHLLGLQYSIFTSNIYVQLIRPMEFKSHLSIAQFRELSPARLFYTSNTTTTTLSWISTVSIKLYVTFII